MLLSEHAVSAVANIVTADDFYKPAHRHIFDAIQALYGAGQGVDPVTVADELDNAGVLDAVGGAATLVRLQAGTPAITNAEHYARIVEEKALLRRLIITANDVAELGYSPLDDIEKTIDSAESLIFAVAQRRNTDSLSELSPLLDRSLEQLEMLYERGDAITGTPSGYTDLDHMLAGLQPGALIVVGARPAMGKTAFSLGIAAHAAVRENLPVLFFSLEMGHLELTQRLIAAEARIDASKLRTGRLTDADWTKITKAMGRLGEGQLWIDDNPALTVMEIRAKARRLQDRLDTKLGLIVVDYLQLMQGRSSAESRQVEVAEISRSLKVLARELGAPVMALSQLSRGLELRSDKRPMLADLRESGCLTASSRILRADTNQEVTLGELLASGERDVPVWSLGEDWTLVPATMTHAFPSGTKPAFRLRLASGRQVEATANHPFRTVAGWRRLDELVVGSRIAVPRRLGTPEAVRADDPSDVADLVQRALAEGRVPAEVPALADPALAAFVRGVFGGIGAVAVGTLRGRPHVRVMATTASRPLVDQLQLLLLRFGVLSRITDVGRGAPRWRLWIHGVEHQRRFLSDVGLDGDAAALVAPALDALAGRGRQPQRGHGSVRGAGRGGGGAGPAGHDPAGPGPGPGGAVLRGLPAGNGGPSPFLQPGPPGPDRGGGGQQGAGRAGVLGRLLGRGGRGGGRSARSRVYDATVLGTHNFVANGIVVHNSIEQDADVVMFLYRDEVYHPDTTDKDTAEVIVAKHRAGRTGVCRLVFLDYCTLFANMAKGD